MVTTKAVNFKQRVMFRQSRKLLLLVGTGLLVLSGLTQAGVPLPQVSKGEGEACVEPTDVMRRDHMNFILHQRDDTVHRGIRTSRHSLQGCIDCHATRKDDGQFVRIDEPEHFCASCHRYAAVTVDCFQCHRDTPLEGQEGQISPDVNARGDWNEGSEDRLPRELSQFLASPVRQPIAATHSRNP